MHPIPGMESATLLFRDGKLGLYASRAVGNGSLDPIDSQMARDGEDNLETLDEQRKVR